MFKTVQNNNLWLQNRPNRCFNILPYQLQDGWTNLLYENRQGLASLLYIQCERCGNLNKVATLPVSLQFLLLLFFIIVYVYIKNHSYAFFLHSIYAKTSISGILNVTRYRMTKINVKTILGHNNLVFTCFYDFIHLSY